MDEDLLCFTDTMKVPHENDLKEKCPKACISTMYSILPQDTVIFEEAKFLKLAIGFGLGEEWANYILDKKSALFYADYTSTQSQVQLMSRTSLVHVNFIKPEANLITKDAKVTFPDMLGTIGGTFGVFLGLSFVGILDFIIVCLQWIQNT